MKIGFAGPIDTVLLGEVLQLDEALPPAYAVPMNALLVAALLEKGHEVSVFGLSDKIDAPRDWDFGKLKVHLGRFRGGKRARDFFKIERADLRAAMERDPCDILNAHWTYEYALAALRVRPDAIVTVRDWAPAILAQMPDAYRLVRLAMASKVFLKGRYFTANSPYIQSRVASWTRKPVDLIPNGLADSAFQKVAKWKAAEEPRSVVAVNRGFFKRKNLPALLRAFVDIHRNDPHIRLRLLGHGSGEGSDGHAWALKEGLTKGVDFVGLVPFSEVQREIANSALLVHPSHEESFGMVLIEAMAKGVPVIGGRKSGAVPWVLDEGRAGKLVDVASVQALSGAMAHLLDSQSQWEAFSEAGFDHASRSFKMSAVADRYVRRYEKEITAAEAAA